MSRRRHIDSSEPPLAPGAAVTVISLNRRGVVEEELRPGVFRVRVGAMVTTVDAGGLRPATTRKSRTTAPAAAHRDDPNPSDVRELASLDLHGLTVDEARNRVAGHISRAILAGLDRVDIIHGIGTGRLKTAVTADLRRLPSIRRVAPHPSNPGVLVVYL